MAFAPCDDSSRKIINNRAVGAGSSPGQPPPTPGKQLRSRIDCSSPICMPRSRPSSVRFSHLRYGVADVKQIDQRSPHLPD
ncbi:hypothetical protein KCP69_22360 [Salmonella enterica subsp. enterica]|nr:hypothetical protein KCP69_22360 [Salmonella enterica subsp. enterica]